MPHDHNMANTMSTVGPNPIAQSTQSTSNRSISGLPSQLASSQNELVQLVNTIVATYSSSPVLLSSLQQDMANLLQGIPPAHMSMMQQQTQSQSTNINARETPQNANQEPVASIIDGVVRFLTQRQSAPVPPTVAGHQPMNFPSLSSNMNMLQQQSPAAPLLSNNATQGYNSQVIQQMGPNMLLNNPNIQGLLGNLHQHTLQPYGATQPPTNTDSATTITASSNDQQGINVDQAAASDTSFSNSTGEVSTSHVARTEGQAIPPRNTRKRERSPSLDKK